MASKGKILIVDDEPYLRQSLAAILEDEGYTALTAENGTQAMERISNEYFDLVFLDLKLPDINGMDLLPKIKHIDGKLPILILTAHATLDTAIEAVRIGARDYLLKPIDPHTIIERVNIVMAERADPQHQREFMDRVKELLTELQGTGAKEAIPAAGSAKEMEDPKRYLQVGKIKVDLQTRHIHIENKTIALPPTSFDYLVILMRHSPRAVSFENLVKEAQGYELTRLEARDMSRWHIHKIRKAMEQNPSDPQYIITERDFGYRVVG